MSRLHATSTALGAALAVSLALAGCNETSANMGTPETSVATASPAAGFRLPPGAPCSGEINRFQDVVKSDLDTGNVERKIYEQIETDLNRAASACSAGKGSEAHAIVAASKARHGYHA